MRFKPCRRASLATSGPQALNTTQHRKGFKPCRRASLATSLGALPALITGSVSSHVAELRWRHPAGSPTTPSCQAAFQAMSPSFAGDIFFRFLISNSDSGCFKPCRRASLATSRRRPHGRRRRGRRFKPCRRASLATSSKCVELIVYTEVSSHVAELRWRHPSSRPRCSSRPALRFKPCRRASLATSLEALTSAVGYGRFKPCRRASLATSDGMSCAVVAALSFKPCRRASLATSTRRLSSPAPHGVSSHVAELRWRHLCIQADSGNLLPVSSHVAELRWRHHRHGVGSTK